MDWDSHINIEYVALGDVYNIFIDIVKKVQHEGKESR